MSARYCCDPREVNGANPTMKKWRRGKGMRLTASFRRSELSWPGNLKQHVTPDIVAEIRWFKSPTVMKEQEQEHKRYNKLETGNGIRREKRGLTARSSELEGSKADIIKSFVVKDHALISILN